MCEQHAPVASPPPTTCTAAQPHSRTAALAVDKRPAAAATCRHVYASPGPDRDKFVALVDAFNSRADNPTAWVLQLHGDAGAAAQLEQLVADGLASVVVLAGKNDSKLATISQLVAAGIHVLADKPWATNLDCLDDLTAATQPPSDSPALAMDIMTNKHDTIARLRREIVHDPTLFGAFQTDGDLPCVEIGSVHHLAKLVNGAPLQRPAWYYDVTVQGNGLVDITAHMVDQVQWLLAGSDGGGGGGGGNFDYATDCELLAASTSDTEVPLALFSDSTGMEAFPEFLSGLLRESDPEGSGPLWAGGGGETVLPLAANGALHYKLRGVSVLHTAEWRPREPEGGGDLHTATLRGSLCEIAMRADEETGYKPELLLRPTSSTEEGQAAFGEALQAAVARWSASPQFRGVSARRREEDTASAAGGGGGGGGGWVIDVPKDISPTHEEHFALVMEEFLDHIGNGGGGGGGAAGEGGRGGWPASLTAAIRMRYTLLAHAHELGERARAKH
jgi:hypothetical protein